MGGFRGLLTGRLGGLETWSTDIEDLWPPIECLGTTEVTSNPI